MSYSLSSFAELLVKAAVVIPDEIEHGLKKAAEMLEAEAKAIVGTDALAPNAPATVERKGFDAPGLETGEMRDLITHNADRHEAYIGSDNEKLKWLEFGTKKEGAAWGGPNPPRPVLGLTAVRKGERAAEIVGHAVSVALAIP